MSNDPIAPGAIAPEASFQDVDGKTLTTKDVLKAAGGLPTVFAFFKNSCPTCQLTWPYLEKLQKRYGKAGARIVGVSQDDVAAANRFYNEFGNATFEKLVDPKPGYAASNAFGVESVPFVLLVRANGKVEQTFTGWQRQALEDMGKKIAELAGLPYLRVIDVNDGVPPWKAG